jgi:oleandomycin transport system permease protein
MFATQVIPPVIQQVLAATVYGEQLTSVPKPIQVGSPSLVQSSNINMFDYMAPGIFAYAAIFLTMTVAQSFTADRENGLLRRINITPTTPTEFMTSQAISNMIIALIQVALVFIMANLVGFRPKGDATSFALAFVIMMIFSLCNVGFGLITATIAKSPGAATGLSFVFIMPQMFLGTFVGFALSPSAQAAGKFVPSYYVTNALTSLFLRGAPASSPTILLDISVISISSVIALLFGIMLFRKYGKA